MNIFTVGKVQIFLVALGFLFEAIANLVRLITGSPAAFIWWSLHLVVYSGLPASAFLASIIGPTVSRRRIAFSWRWALEGVLLYILGVGIGYAVAAIVIVVVFFLTYAG